MDSNKQTLVSLTPEYLICIDEITQIGIRGKIYTGDSEHSNIEFKDLTEILIKIDNICNIIRCPMAWEDIAGEEPSKNFDELRARKILNNMRGLDKNAHKGKIATVLLNIMSRQYAGWQGKLIHLEFDKEYRFKSELEFLKLLDNICKI